ncbi:MAG: hypothetical protein KF760_33165 [Candidatus Eremiobacteraeota bacterium]|nr:hypothetical protein [Candidatus Eremiobacteraeota bacterium]MCW5870193.1 hypothetical protein [Candidatus Eremiobacteraeota bacterium]
MSQLAIAGDWAEQNKERLQASFADQLGSQFGERAIIDRSGRRMLPHRLWRLSQRSP